ncbi:MAG: hypothetical protein CO094_07610 [Anaerolineae bacterium CG_4_9_14_3_um_filter_57_17]|nr:MAG: hypothetical protein AUK01_09115 [Anaerolineae bacterium CG2_30_57_67]PJB66243.1 MAG: hypothetical protein CO094_07610 [Anaerolineae bacterium CG_4_9_14_3_um_filter_57_17]
MGNRKPAEQGGKPGGWAVTIKIDIENGPTLALRFTMLLPLNEIYCLFMDASGGKTPPSQ